MEAKKIDLSKSVFELCSENPELPGILSELGFTDITKPGMINTVGRFMTIPKGANMKKIDMNKIKEIFAEHGISI